MSIITIAIFYEYIFYIFFSVGKYLFSSESNFYGVLRVVSTSTEVK